MIPRNSDAAWQLILRAFDKHPLLALRATKMMILAKRVKVVEYPTYTPIGHRLMRAMEQVYPNARDRPPSPIPESDFPRIAAAYAKLWGPKP